MEPSLAGLLVFLALLGLGYALGSPVIVGLFASLTFGSTAIVTLGALGGSSPLVYTPFTVLLLAAVALRRGFADELITVFSRHWTAWIVGVLIVYSIASAILFPRLFAGMTTVFVTRPGLGVVELPLAPVSGNIAQTGYFVVGAFCFYAFAILMTRKENVAIVRRGFVTWAIFHTGLGLMDLFGKLLGVGDVLAPIRTASHEFLVEVEQSGFWRIVGGRSEASSFGIVTVSCIAFTFTFWQATRSLFMLGMTVVLFFLLLLSTSTTAYAGFALVAPFGAATIVLSAIRGRFSLQETMLIAFGWLTLAAILAVYLYNERILDPVIELFDAIVLNKATSESFAQRTYWNAKSIAALIDTWGVGVGLGSSRAASWIVATLSQLGVVGGILMAGLVCVFLRDLVAPKPRYATSDATALASSARATALASLAAASVSSGSADPGLLFFISLGIVVAYRKHQFNN
jgi:hypothetical protein